MSIQTLEHKEPLIKSLLSFQPLVLSLKRMIAEDKPGARKLYGELVNSLENSPELQHPIEDEETLVKNQEIIDTLCVTIFPPTDSKKETLYAVTYPFGFQIVFASSPFKELFMTPGSDMINIPGLETLETVSQASLQLAYNLILRKFYKKTFPDFTTFIFPFTDQKEGLKKMEVRLDARFTNVKKVDPDRELPDRQYIVSSNVDDLTHFLPIDQFVFEGVLIIDVSDVTEREVISDIKNILITINSFSDSSVYENLQVHIQTLIGLKNIRIGITPFFRVNGFYLFSDVHTKNSLLFKNSKTKQKIRISDYCQTRFKETSQPLFFEELTEKSSGFQELLQNYFQQGFNSLIIYPLKNNNGLIGILEIAAADSGTLQAEHINKIEPAIPLFTLALEKSQENLEIEIDRKIKENFTAIQSVVEWKFTEAAFQYLQQKQFNENAKIPPIIFENVYPLFGAVDIRNSSVERSKAIQNDLVEQLRNVNEVLTGIEGQDQFPLLKELNYKVKKYLDISPDQWMSEDEMLIHEFLQTEASSVFTNLRKNMPELEKVIDKYMKSLDPERKMVYDHRKRYEDSITLINDTLAHFLDEEQQGAQKVFPHYFERYVTDGVEFNIYIGASLAPQFQFDEIYVRNLKMWQLGILAKAARRIRELQPKLPLKMETTQLILANSTAISISFRSMERKFDVDGSYNMRYEIMKKRIDKAHVKDTEERLTQPGTIAIVYSQQKERDEYMEYVEFMRNEGLLGEKVEELELEELQGISGMHAIRVDICFDKLPEAEKTDVAKSNGKAKG